MLTSMNLFREAPLGRSIDQSDAVFRFNNEAARMAHVLNERGGGRGRGGREWDEARMAKYLGSKSTIRLLNRKYTNQV
jgi:hypothetical protein